MSVNAEIWFPVDPAIFAIVVAVLILFIVVWLWKLVVSLVTGA